MTDTTNQNVTVTEPSEDQIKQDIEIQKRKLKVFLQNAREKSQQMHSINWGKNQRKRRRNARRAFAAGNRNAFN
jgi:hypothetical protein